MIELELSKIKVDESKSEQVIVFREKNGTRFLPVVIGITEVNAIKMKLSGTKPPRPLTHDLALQIVSHLEAQVTKVVIDRIEQNTFFAKIYLETKQKKEVVIDARPSDSVALALRANVPIFASDEVFREAAINEF